MPTREGTGIAILAAAIFLLATNLMSGLMFVLDALLVSLLCVGVGGSVWPLHRLRATRRTPERGTEGVGVPIEITLEAARGGRFFAVEDGWTGVRARAVAPHLAPGVPTSITITPKDARRGEYLIGPVEVTSRGMLGLFTARRRIAASGTHRITIWPRTRPVPAQVLAYLAPALEGQQADRTREPADFYGVRDYHAGDSLARVHWRSSLRRGSLVVREFEAPRAAAATLVIDLDRRQSPRRLDAAVRAAASVLRLAHDRRVDMVLMGWDERPVEHRQWEAAMDWLAGVVPCGLPLGDTLPAMVGPGGRVIVVASTPVVPAMTGLMAIVPAEDLASSDASPRLVYTEDGAVQAW